MPAFGVYPIADALPASHNEISSTYEGRYVTLTAAELFTSAGSGVATKGLPCIFGLTGLQGVGVCMTSGTTTDLISIDTEGIWNLDVDAEDDGGAGSAVAGGDLLYINVTSGVLSKISDGATQIPFGYALGIITANLTERIAVKVHFDPSLDNAKRTYYTVTSGAYTYGKHHTSVFAGGQSTGLEYFDQYISGTITGPTYGMGTWQEIAADFDLDGNLSVGFEVGVNDAGGDVTSGVCVGIQMQLQWASNPEFFYLFRVNNGAGAGAIDAMFVVGGPDSVGFQAGAETATYSGSIPFYSWGGVVGWIRLYDGPS